MKGLVHNFDLLLMLKIRWRTPSEAFMRGSWILSLFLSLAVAPCMSAPRGHISLDGIWQFTLDPQDRGVAEGWSRLPDRFDRKIRVPGIWQGQGFGEERGQVRHDYQGVAWYGRALTIPSDWAGRKIWLHVGGVLRRARIYVNGKELGNHEGLMTASKVDLGRALKPGEVHWLVIRVDNQMRSGKYTPVKDRTPYGAIEWDYSSPMGAFNYIGNWGGLYRGIYLESTESVWLEETTLNSDIDQETITVASTVRNQLPTQSKQIRYQVIILDQNGKVVAQKNSQEDIRRNKDRSTSLEVKIPDMHLWSPEEPHLYHATVRIDAHREILDEIQLRFGMRKLSTRGKKVLLNNRPYYLRGYSVGRGDPIEGILPIDKDYYLDQFQTAREFGFNYVRYHSSTPPREAFEAADEVGILLHVELPVMFTSWLMPSNELLLRELERILVSHRNHPSLCAVAFGNEFNLERDFHTDAEKSEFLRVIDRFYHTGKELAPDVFIMSNAGYPVYPSDLIASYKGLSAGGVPTLKHESGGYRDSLPDIDLVERFTGVLKADRLAERRHWVEQKDLKRLYPTLRRHSERLQQMVRKWYFEKVRTIPELSGYEFWLLVDSPANHYSDSWEDGLLNYFGEPKAITTEEMRQSNAPTVLLISAGIDDRTFWADAGKKFQLLVSHYAPEAIHDGRVAWSLRQGADTLHQGVLENLQVEVGEVKHLGEIAIPPVVLRGAAKLEFRVELKEGDFRQTNQWSFWAFPRNFLDKVEGEVILRDVRSEYLRQRYPFLIEATRVSSTAKLVIASHLDWEVYDYLRKGGRVFLMAGPNQFDEQVGVNFFPGSGQSIGTYILSEHPAMIDYPHENMCDLQFFSVLNGGAALRIPESPTLWMTSVGGDVGYGRPQSKLADRITPIIWGLKNSGGSSGGGYSRLAWLIETRVGNGRLLLSTLRMSENLDDARPEATYLFDRLLRYVESDRFQPEGSISEEELSGLMTPYVK